MACTVFIEISSLAYPNLLGTKGYVVVVVVVFNQNNHGCLRMHSHYIGYVYLNL
jgi:hypothetical protein